jgi:hypothetical protein
VTVLRHEMYGGEQTRLRPAISWAAQPTAHQLSRSASSPHRIGSVNALRAGSDAVANVGDIHIQKMYGRIDKMEFAPLTNCFYCCCCRRRHDHHQMLRLVGTQ